MKNEIVSIHGSPRERGNSALLAEQIEAGAREAGARVTSFYLHGMNIRPCSACDACQEDTMHPCVVDDDMQTIYRALQKASGVIIASPIYWFSVSGQTKVFLDRCYGLGGPDGNQLRGKQIVIALTYEDADPFKSGAVNALRSFQDMAAWIGAHIVGMVYGTALRAGEIASNAALFEEARELGRLLGSGTVRKT